MADAKPTQRRNAAGLSRDLEVLEVLGTPEALRGHGLGVNRVAELTARDKGQISRTLSTLADAGFVDIALHHRHGYSWSLVGTKPADQ
jgi:DNA-binding IclR family transcriptional regulator